MFFPSVGAVLITGVHCEADTASHNIASLLSPTPLHCILGCTMDVQESSETTSDNAPTVAVQCALLVCQNLAKWTEVGREVAQALGVADCTTEACFPIVCLNCFVAHAVKCLSIPGMDQGAHANLLLEQCFPVAQPNCAISCWSDHFRR